MKDELQPTQKGLQSEPEQGHFKELFSKSNRKRTAIVVALNFFQQATGQAFASQYGTLYVKSLQPQLQRHQWFYRTRHSFTMPIPQR